VDSVDQTDSVTQEEESNGLDTAAALDVAQFLVDDFDRQHSALTTTEILDGLELDAEPSLSPISHPLSPQRTFPLPPLLSIDPNQTILSEDALALLRKASLSGKKVGLGTVATSLVEPGSQGMRQTLSTEPLVGVNDVDKAEAAFSIARQLVDWAESVIVVDAKKQPQDEMPSLSLSGEPIQSSSDIEDALSHSDSDKDSDESEITSDESQDESNSGNQNDTQWISATDYFERRKAEHLKADQLLSRLSVNSPPQEESYITSPTIYSTINQNSGWFNHQSPTSL